MENPEEEQNNEKGNERIIVPVADESALNEKILRRTRILLGQILRNNLDLFPGEESEIAQFVAAVDLTAVRKEVMDLAKVAKLNLVSRRTNKNGVIEKDIFFEDDEERKKRKQREAGEREERRLKHMKAPITRLRIMSHVMEAAARERKMKKVELLHVESMLKTPYNKDDITIDEIKEEINRKEGDNRKEGTSLTNEILSQCLSNKMLLVVIDSLNIEYMKYIESIKNRPREIEKIIRSGSPILSMKTSNIVFAVDNIHFNPTLKLKINTDEEARTRLHKLCPLVKDLSYRGYRAAGGSCLYAVRGPIGPITSTNNLEAPDDIDFFPVVTDPFPDAAYNMTDFPKNLASSVDVLFAKATVAQQIYENFLREVDTIYQQKYAPIYDLVVYRGADCTSIGMDLKSHIVDILHSADGKFNVEILEITSKFTQEERECVELVRGEVGGSDIHNLRAWKLQFIHRAYESEDRIVIGFDLYPSQVLYDGTHFKCTHAAKFSMHNGILPVDISRASKSWATRLKKYSAEKQFILAFPGMDYDKIMSFTESGTEARKHLFRLPCGFGLRRLPTESKHKAYAQFDFILDKNLGHNYPNLKQLLNHAEENGKQEIYENDKDNTEDNTKSESGFNLKNEERFITKESDYNGVCNIESYKSLQSYNLNNFLNIMCTILNQDSNQEYQNNILLYVGSQSISDFLAKPGKPDIRELFLRIADINLQHTRQSMVKLFGRNNNHNGNDNNSHRKNLAKLAWLEFFDENKEKYKEIVEERLLDIMNEMDKILDPLLIIKWRVTNANGQDYGSFNPISITASEFYRDYSCSYGSYVDKMKNDHSMSRTIGLYKSKFNHTQLKSTKNKDIQNADGEELIYDGLLYNGFHCTHYAKQKELIIGFLHFKDKATHQDMFKDCLLIKILPEFLIRHILDFL